MGPITCFIFLAESHGKINVINMLVAFIFKYNKVNELQRIGRAFRSSSVAEMSVPD